MPDGTRAAALHNFIGRLRDAFERAGPPTYVRLEYLSKHGRNPALNTGLRVLELPHSTIHDILNGKRKTLPQWHVVSSLLHVLRSAAEENGLDPETIGTHAEWHARYQEAQTAIKQAASPAKPTMTPAVPTALSRRSSPSEPADPPTDAGGRNASEPSESSTPPASSAHTDPSHAGLPRLPAVDELLLSVRPDRAHSAPGAGPPWSGTSTNTLSGVSSGVHVGGARGGDAVGEERPSTVPPPEPTIMWRRYVEAYGRTGMRLLRRAEVDEGSARGVPAYQLATLLACEDRPDEALSWLRRAAQAGHIHARRLAHDWDPAEDAAPPRYWRPDDAAYEIGTEYEAAGQPFSAVVFFDRAAENGHVEAAYRAGLHHMQLGHHWDAMLLFSRAAIGGHEAARHELNALLRRFDHRAPGTVLPRPLGRTPVAE